MIRSTILLGYPGEDEDSFAEVMDFLIQAQLDWVGSFVYSLEEGTKAAELTNERAHRKLASKARRFQQELEALQLSITQARLKTFVGRKIDVLIEEHVEGEEFLYRPNLRPGARGGRPDRRVGRRLGAGNGGPMRDNPRKRHRLRGGSPLWRI